MQTGPNWNIGFEFTFLKPRFENNVAFSTMQADGASFESFRDTEFDDIDISSTIPSDTFSAGSSIEAYTIDVEATKDICFQSWFVSASTGIRFASVEQSYLAELRDNTGTARGRIDHQQTLDRIGPTIGIQTARPVTYNLIVFGKARGSILLADGESTLNAGEDLTSPLRS